MSTLTKFDSNNVALQAALIAAYAGKKPAELAGNLLVVYGQELNMEFLSRDQAHARLESAVSRSTIARAITPLDVILVSRPPKDIFTILRNEVAIIVAAQNEPVALGANVNELPVAGYPRNRVAQAAVLRSMFFGPTNLRTVTIARGDTSVVFTRPIDPPPVGPDAPIPVNPSAEDVAASVQSILSDVKPFDLGALQNAVGGVLTDLTIDYDLRTNAVVYYQK